MRVGVGQVLVLVVVTAGVDVAVASVGANEAPKEALAWNEKALLKDAHPAPTGANS